MFEFQNEQHIAMVTLSEGAKGTIAYKVQLFNHELFYLVPDGKFMFAFTDNRLPPFIQSRTAAALFHTVKSAVYYHLNPQPATAHEKMKNEIKHDPNTDFQL